MKKYLLYILILFTVFTCKNKTSENVDDIPQNKRQFVVYDSSKMFLESEKDLLTKKLIDYEIETTNEIAIATIDSLPKNVEALDYARDISNDWGIGKKEKNNGLLLLISKYDREMAIATGYGTEKILTDSICKTIIDKTIVPEFKNGNYYKGVDKGLDSIIAKWK